MITTEDIITLLSVFKQWGKFTGSSTLTLTFPLAFTSTNYIVMAGFEWESKSSVFAPLITQKSTKAATVYVDDSRSFTKTYIAVGT